MIFDDDTVTLREAAHSSEGGMIVMSRQLPRRPRGETPILTLMGKPFTYTPPMGCAYCSDCGEWRPVSYFAVNPTRKQGHDYICKQCKNDLDRKRRVDIAAQEGRVLRKYYKAA